MKTDSSQYPGCMRKSCRSKKVTEVTVEHAVSQRISWIKALPPKLPVAVRPFLWGTAQGRNKKYSQDQQQEKHESRQLQDSLLSLTPNTQYTGQDAGQDVEHFLIIFLVQGNIFFESDNLCGHVFRLEQRIFISRQNIKCCASLVSVFHSCTDSK